MSSDWKTGVLDDQREQMYRDSASQVRDGCGTRWRYLPVNVCIMAWVSLPRELPVKVSVSHGARGRL